MSIGSLPRGWSIFASGSATALATITIPAVANVGHVLTDISVQVYLSGVAAVRFFYVLVNSGGGNALQGYMVVNTSQQTSPNYYDLENYSWSGSIAAPPGQSLVISLSGTATNTSQTLVVSGYDI